MLLRSGQIVLADWRGNALPTEANKRRPAIVVDDEHLLDPGLLTVLLVPLTGDAMSAIRGLSMQIEPTPENGCSKTCWALSHMVTATSKLRVTATPSYVTPEQLAAIRQQIALAVGAQP
jgi:mRNA-degrading endonuclease toxin of MazEF toxin-antitoxin module